MLSGTDVSNVTGKVPERRSGHVAKPRNDYGLEHCGEGIACSGRDAEKTDQPNWFVSLHRFLVRRGPHPAGRGLLCYDFGETASIIGGCCHDSFVKEPLFPTVRRV